MSTIIKQVDVQQLAELRQIGDKYAQGIASSSRAILSQVFHKDAIIFGNAWGSLMGGHIEKLYDAVEGHGPSPNMTYHVDVLSVTPTSAVLRVHLDNLVTGYGYEDNLSLIKDEDKWSIVCKIFQEFKSTA
jgi:hypothetical protein